MTTTIAPLAKVPMTENEFLCLPSDGQKWELVDGEPKAMPIDGGSLLPGFQCHVADLFAID